MGFTGSFVLAAATAGELDWLGDALDTRALVTQTFDSQSLGAWTAAVYDDTEPFDRRAEVLARLVAETGRPALVAITLDSDFLGVAGLAPDGQGWSGAVDPEAAAAHREEAGDEGDDGLPVFAPVDVAVPGALAWAAAGGLVADAHGLRRVLAADGDGPADQRWGDLVTALGLVEPSGPAVAGSPPPAAPSSPRRGSSLRRPLDRVVRDRMDPVLTAAGFRRKGRRWTAESDAGDQARVFVHASKLGRHDAEFHVELDVEPRVWRDFRDWRFGGGADGLWWGRLRVPGAKAPFDDHWGVDLGDEAAGALLSASLAEAVRFLLRVREPENLLALARLPREQRPGAGLGQLNRPEITVAVLLAALGRADELDHALAFFEQRAREDEWSDAAFVAFVRRWAAEHP
ncbi:MAG TPA: hypothetical protein VNS46_09960 [Nocardioides sp.]|nr:hypothetical protein [Nocardioides sp.]